MGNIRTYIQKNRFFVSLLTVILVIIAGLSVYMVVHAEPKEKEVNAKPVVEQPVDTKKTAEITDLESEYRKDLRYIDVTWSYEKHHSSISSIGLYINDEYVDNVMPYSSYQISKDAYNFPTGNNTIRLVLNLSNGKSVEKKTTVFVNYVTSMQQSVKQLDGATEITLTYVYDKVHEVAVPSIFITDASIVSSRIDYVGTTRKENQGSVTAKTTYRIVWPPDNSGYQVFGVRWSFKDIQYSKDFEAEKGKP